MKKILLSLALVAAFSLNAAVTTQKIVYYTIEKQEKEYKKIDIAEVSKDAMDKIKKKYGDYTIKEAYKAVDGEYKLVLSKEGTDLTATFTATGDLIKIIS